MNNNRTKAAVLGGTLAAGAALALLSPSSPALAYDSDGLYFAIAVQSPATLVARGAAVDVTVEVTCNVHDPSAYVKLTERSGNWLVNGEGLLQLPACTGSPQRVVVRVIAQGQRPFAMGTGLASASISGCDYIGSVCGYESTSATIKIIK
jgi:hypothetical protein